MAFYQQTEKGWSQAPGSSGANGPNLGAGGVMPPPPTGDPSAHQQGYPAGTAPPHAASSQPPQENLHTNVPPQGYYTQGPAGGPQYPPSQQQLYAQQTPEYSKQPPGGPQYPPSQQQPYAQQMPQYPEQPPGAHQAGYQPQHSPGLPLGPPPIGSRASGPGYAPSTAPPVGGSQMPGGPANGYPQPTAPNSSSHSFGEAFDNSGGGRRKPLSINPLGGRKGRGKDSSPHPLTSFQVGTPMASPPITPKRRGSLEGSQYFAPSYPPTQPGGYPATAGYPPVAYPSRPPRIDPDQIPRAAWEEKLEHQIFCTRPPGADSLAKQGEYSSSGLVRYVPPTCLSKFTVKDEGNASPRFIRATLNCVPTLNSTLAMTQLPFAIVVQPMANVAKDEDPVPLLDFGEAGPVRCQRCRGYINPFVRWLRNGKKWSCNLCGMVNDVVDTYQCPLDASGRRKDVESRPELCRGSVDYAVGPDYCVRPIQQPIYVFAIDVSAYSNHTGFMEASFDAVRVALRRLPGGPRSRVGVITFSSQIHFYRPSPSGEGDPQMLIMSDIKDPFAPLPAQDWLFSTSKNETTLQLLLEQIPELLAAHGNRGDVVSDEGGISNGLGPGSERCALGAVLKAGQLALGDTGGNLIVMSSLPATCGVGAMSTQLQRANPALYGTEKERLMFSPITFSAKKEDQDLGAFYEEIGRASANLQITIDIYLAHQESQHFLDVATLGLVTQTCGGKIHLVDGSMGQETIRRELQESLLLGLSVRRATEAVLKVRCGQGVDVQKTSGPGNHGQGTTRGEIELATVDVNTTLTAFLRLDGVKIESDSEICLQAALLYTTPDTCQRRVRVHTLCLATHEQVNNVFRLTDLDAVSKVFAAQAALATSLKPPVEARDHIINSAVAPLVGYREKCASHSPPGQLILPEALKLLPFLLLSLLKSIIVRQNPPETANSGGVPDPGADERAFQHLAISSMPIESVMQYLHPKLYLLKDMDLTVGEPDPLSSAGDIKLPSIAPRTSSEHLSAEGVALLDAGMQLYLYLGYAVPEGLVAELFGASADPSHPGPYELAPESDLANQVQKVVQHLRSSQFPYKALKIIRSGNQRKGGSNEQRFLSLLIEDKTKHNVSYVDFLCKVHKLVQQKIAD